MSLQTRITALVQAIGADIKALYSGKVGTSDARLTDAREWTASTVSQAEAEAGTATTRRAWTAQRVRQAIAAWWAASAMKTKLDGIATGATANATDAQLRDRATHTGTQAISTVSGLQTALDGKINTSERGVSGGVATLDQFARIPPSQLPSYVDDVLEYLTTAAFPATGETGKIYIAINQGTAANPTRQYRWTGSIYAEINPSPGTTDALTEGSTNLYFSESRVRNTVLTGLNLASSAAVAATDNVLAAFGKIQARLSLLGTAANANVQTSPTDTTAGALMPVGAFGLGSADGTFQEAGQDWKGSRIRGWVGTGALNGPSNTDSMGWDLGYAAIRRFQAAITRHNEFKFRHITDAASTEPWRNVWHDGNFNPATKQDKSSLITTAISRTLALTDAWNYVRPGTTAAITLTVPTNASVAFDIGTEITVRALGNVTLAAASGVSLNAPSGGTLNMTARMTVTLKKVAADQWDVIGQTVAA
ncbi:hypothetical protein [Stutzerimonas kunmingensis]|uniref:hypothetical protein n=1 Tax=Stutzerimonas kunmingensis TaxID=1211807 RepID=UPI00241FB173|nr:hypothetical protein [Stutzerimonas kunmingensis]